MQELHSQSERTSQQLNQTGASALANLMAALVKLSNREKKGEDKKLTVTREVSDETPAIELTTVSRTSSPKQDMDSKFKVTRTDSNNPDLSPEQQAERSIEKLNSTLANQRQFKREIEVDGTKYDVEKHQNGTIIIQSDDAKLSAKSNDFSFFAKPKKLNLEGNTSKLVKDLPDIVARVDRELDLERPKQINNRTEVLYGYDSSNDFVSKLSQKDAQAVLDLMDSKQGTTIAGGENLLIEYDGKPLFETDAQGVVIFSAYDRDPQLLSSIKLKDEKGLTELTNYAKRMAATPDREVTVSKTNSKPESVPEPPQAATTVAPQSPIGKTLDRAEPTTEVDSSQTSSVVYDRVLKSEFDGSKSKRPEKTIEGVKFKLNSKTQEGSRSISVKPSGAVDFVQIGKIGKDGKFEPNPKLNDPNVTKALEKVLAARGIDPQPVKEAQQLEVATQSKDPDYVTLTEENSPKPKPKVANSRELATAGKAPNTKTPKPKQKTNSNSPELATAADVSTVGTAVAANAVINSAELAPDGNTPGVSTSVLPNVGNAPGVSKPNPSSTIGIESPESPPTPTNDRGVVVPTHGEQEAVTVPTHGGNSTRSRPEPQPEISQSR
jgi:hypothetical protein